MAHPKRRSNPPAGVQTTAEVTPDFATILTPDALGFLAGLARRFGGRRDELLQARQRRQQAFDRGERPDFLAQTGDIRRGDWRVSPVPADLQDRRVEITGPVERKMIINALNSGARVYMADFEDAHTPTWPGTLQGQINLADAVRGTIAYASPQGKHYALHERVATLMVRPRGWHLPEKHLLVDGTPIPGALFDFGLFLHHNARHLLDKGTGPYFYLPKLEGHLEARLWRDVFHYAEQALALPHASIKATVLIETLPAAFEMDEILYELRDCCVGLNCGRWDYIFSFIKKFRADPQCVLPDRGQVTMTCHFLRSYSRLLIETCHRRGAFAMGGMAAQIPIRDDPQANAAALAKVKQDKEREAGDGHDGTWVAHPGLVPVAMEVFDRHMTGPNQLDRPQEALRITAADLLEIPEGDITEAGLRNDIDVGVQYLAAWLGGQGSVPIHHLMEDAATAEIARAQIWQWIRHPKGVLEDGRRVTVALFRRLLDEQLETIRRESRHHPAPGDYAEAAALLDDIVTHDDFVEFLTLEAYKHLP